ncbi:hypothetical protein [Delftia acidovorans]|uniref:hypothetical protein n=1 Tax=Delftia acidovorans TaxID=80866 RepID=UPI00068BF20E|nr:hypothetical protein [Delftia acidovorans]ATH14051.1 hypothetical protein CHL79_17245 [Delftia acidovorans]QQB51470.1 hypothetical protein I6H54_04105 [Delftia acidovorans]
MERAQLAGWFQPFGTATGDIAQHNPKTQARPVQAGAPGPATPQAAQRQPQMSMPGQAQARPVAAADSGITRTASASGAAPALAEKASPGLAAAGRSGTWESLSPRSGHGLSMGDSSAAVAAYAAAGADAASAGEGGAPGLAKAVSAAASQQASAASATAAAPAAPEHAGIRPPIQMAVQTAALLSASPSAALALLAVRDAAAPATAVPGADRPSTRASQSPASPSAASGPAIARWQGAAQAQGMRMHAQWTERGVQLWLGLDGSAQQVGVQAQAVVYSLHRLLRDQGQQLSRVVCNGQVVFDAATARAGAGRALHEFSDLFDRYASATPGMPAFLPSSSKEIS